MSFLVCLVTCSHLAIFWLGWLLRQHHTRDANRSVANRLLTMADHVDEPKARILRETAEDIIEAS